MDRGGRRVYVDSGYDYRRTMRIYFVSTSNGTQYIDWYDSSKRVYTRIPAPEGSISPNPTFEIQYEDALDLYKELHTYFSKQGIKNEGESFICGELSGTKRHLDDLRHLLKLPKG